MIRYAAVHGSPPGGSRFYFCKSHVLDPVTIFTILACCEPLGTGIRKCRNAISLSCTSIKSRVRCGTDLAQRSENEGTETCHMTYLVTKKADP